MKFVSELAIIYSISNWINASYLGILLNRIVCNFTLACFHSCAQPDTKAVLQG